MADDKRPLKVFLCHASADKPKVRELYHYLKKRGIQPWLDAEDLLPGQNWQVEIPKALECSDAIIICISKCSVDKEGYVQKEIKFALDKALELPDGRIFIIPARLDECDVPRPLSIYHWVDLFDEGGYDKLMKSLKARAAQLQRSNIQTPKADESSPSLTEKPKDGISVQVNGNVQGNIIIGNENAVQSETSNGENSVDKQQKELELKSLESMAIQHELKGDFWNAVQTWYKIKKIDQLYPRVDIKINQLERELRPKPNLLLHNRKLMLFWLPIILFIIVLISLLIILIFNGFPFIFAHEQTPTATTTIPVIQTPKATLTVLSPSETPEPNLTSTEAFAFTPTPTHLPTEITDVKGVTMRFVPAGSFAMGSDNGQDDEKPIHTVTLDAFYMDVYEVTNTNYMICVDAGKCKAPGVSQSSTRPSYYGNVQYGNYPVIYMDWNRAKTYCEWRGARLPTEAEWEKAARGGLEGKLYPWGDDAPVCKMGARNGANFDDNAGCKYTDTGPVGNFFPNGYGLYDMAGNVWEWVADWYNAYQGGAVSKDAYGMKSHVLRGGSWKMRIEDRVNLRVSSRLSSSSDVSSNNDWGFRCALDAQP